MSQSNKHDGVVIYQAKSGALELRTGAKNETIWANRMEMAKMFEVNTQAISKHIQNIYKEGELLKKGTSSKKELVQNEAGRIVRRSVDIYNLDVLIAVGYRINSVVGTKFRKWATKILRTFITEGYVINKEHISDNYQKFLEAVDDIKKLIPSNSNIDNISVLELVSAFADTWLSLNAYDKDDLLTKGETKKQVTLTAEKLGKFLDEFKKELIRKGEATDIFGIEIRKDVLAGIVGNVMQSFDGKELYSSVEEKAAHLLYFIVKNHPFIDGNKRSGAFAFIWFLKKAGILKRSKITPSTLTALTLFIAESNPKNKEKMIKIILQLLKK